MKTSCEVLWCSSYPKGSADGWAFPKAVRDLLIRECNGMTVLHLFGGKADFGIRMDIDPRTRPHIVADAWLPPFGRDSFDVVVLDPPYVGDYGSSVFTRTSTLLRIAAWIARQSVIWFHPMWLRSPVRMRLRKGFVVCGGNRRAVRSLQLFDVPEPDRKLEPFAYFTRGPAIKYNRWLLPMDMLPLMDGLPEVKLHPVTGLESEKQL